MTNPKRRRSRPHPETKGIKHISAASSQDLLPCHPSALWHGAAIPMRMRSMGDPVPLCRGISPGIWSQCGYAQQAPRRLRSCQAESLAGLGCPGCVDRSLSQRGVGSEPPPRRRCRSIARLDNLNGRSCGRRYRMALKIRPAGIRRDGAHSQSWPSTLRSCQRSLFRMSEKRRHPDSNWG